MNTWAFAIGLHTQQLNRPVLHEPPPVTWHAGLVLPHGPDEPDDIPEDGYEFKATSGERPVLLLAGLGTLAAGSVTAAAARSQRFKMERATTLPELDQAYDTQKKLAYVSYTLWGAAGVLFILEIPF